MSGQFVPFPSIPRSCAKSARPARFFSSNSLRLDLNAPWGETGHLELAGENSLLYADPEELLLVPTDAVNRLVPLDKAWPDELRPGQSTSTRSLQSAIQPPRHRLGPWPTGTIGFRHMLIVALDVIAPFAPDAIDRVSRPGVDALRATRYFGTTQGRSAASRSWATAAICSFLTTFSANSHGIDLAAQAGLRGRPMQGSVWPASSTGWASRGGGFFPRPG
ncbi:MAG: hypothetical protein R2864_10650 [Syntrophotaleaceae bacterium]